MSSKQNLVAVLILYITYLSGSGVVNVDFVAEYTLSTVGFIPGQCNRGGCLSS